MTNTTKVAIKESIIRLLNRKPLNKITVKEIVDDCGINRNTFYYHYADIRALLEEIFIEQSNQLLRTVEGKSVYECLTTAISFAFMRHRAEPPASRGRRSSCALLQEPDDRLGGRLAERRNEVRPFRQAKARLRAV